MQLRSEETWGSHAVSSFTIGRWTQVFSKPFTVLIIPRCELSTDDMVKMIQKEMENLKELQADLDNGIDTDSQMEKEKEDLMKEIKEDNIDLDKNWNWA